MERVEQLREELKDALKGFEMAQDRKQQYLSEIQKTIITIVQHYTTENLRMGMQDYFEERNNRLHTTLQDIDECLNRASEAHALVSNYRTQLLDACNDKMQPVTTVTDGPILLSGQGVEDLQDISTKTEQSVLEVNNLQEEYSRVMTDIGEHIPEKVSKILSESRERITLADQERSKEAIHVFQQSSEELDKAVKVLESMEMMKQQMEHLFQLLRTPNNSA
ncbi:hypothetical protein Pmani_021037 [Petrolisthes manimaculis]|uniref:Uncharacterized protein n=1 Tax=Petrolisthes manimaculis TaxID=1843537 RepID=A0AAE1PFM6_9EUCA|nr:hypothetical protein Pmani_021037 [Petrolisthes manimaculis]